MALGRTNGANNPEASRIAGRTPSRWLALGVAALLLSTGVLYAAGTVAAARGPDPQVAYGPPFSPDNYFQSQDFSQTEAAPPPHTNFTTSSMEGTPVTIASSWSMSPLPEGPGETVTSSTSQGPVVQTSSNVASDQ